MTVKILNETMWSWFNPAFMSIVNQTRKPDQIVVVNDASPLFKDWDALKQAKVINLDKSYGIANAKNVGLNFCTGDLIVVFDGDDIAYPNLLEKQVEFMDAHPEVSACGVQLEAFHFETGEPMTLGGGFPTKHPAGIDYDTAIWLGKQDCFWWANQPAICYRKDAVMEIGGYREGKWQGRNVAGMEDMVMWLRMVRVGMRIRNHQEVLARYRWKPSARTFDNTEYQLALKHEHAKFMKGQME